HAAMQPAADLLGRQLGEPPLDEVQPRPIRGREVHVEAWPLGEPALNQGRLVRAVVVQDEMDGELYRDGCVNRNEEPAELDRAVAAMELPDDVAGLHVEGGEQRGRAVAGIVVGAALDLPGP